MGFFYVPPPAQVGGAQPYAAPVHSVVFTQSIDAPPGRSVVYGDWSAPEFRFFPGGRQPYAGGNFVAIFGAVAVNNPPTIDGMAPANLNALLTLWRAPDPMPAQRGPLSPALTNVTVSTPPVISDPTPAQFAAILQTWRAPDPQPQQKINLNAGFLGLPVNPPAPLNVQALLEPVLSTWNLPPTPYYQQKLANPSIFVTPPGPGGGGGRAVRKPSLHQKRQGSPWGPIISRH